LFWEDFSNDEIPLGWEMELNWQVGSEGYDEHVVGDPPPGAFFYWTPSQTDYEGAMTTPVINVGDEPQVLVEFFFELDFWSAGSATNGLRIEYLSGGDWVTILSYEISPSAGDVDLSGRYESFTADVNGDFRIRWVAYGTNSTYINSWDVDNIRVSTLPKLTYVNIESSNEDPSTAYEGTYIWLNFTTDTEFSFDPYVQINGNPCNIDNLGYSNWVAYYTVQESDPDGPLQFTIDFTDINGIEGKTVKETTDESTVIVDNSVPPSFTVGAVTAAGGTVASEIWNSTNTEIQLEVNIPEDSAVTSFSYTIGNSLLFNGMNDEVIISGVTEYQATDALTIEAWIKPNSWSDFDGILNYAADQGASEAGFGFIYFATGWRFFLKTTSNSIDYISMAEVSTPSGQWTHLAATYDGAKVRIFRNGSAIDSTDAMGDIQWSGAPSDFKLGSFTKDGSTGYFDGQIDDVRIWNIVRTGVQIKASREITIDKNESGLVGYWQMDAGSGGTATDSTSIANHGIINGATWVVEDSPLSFQAPVYDTGVIVGSAFQLRGRINTNDFEVFGEKDTITVNDLNAGIKTVSASSDAFEAITGFAHEEIAQLSAFLFDVTGNYSLGDTSTTNTVIDMIANSPTPVSIYSDNTFSHLAKTGDIVTITMAYDEDVNTPAVAVDGNDADDVSDLGGEQFSSTYTLTGSESEGSLSFSINATDYLGNPGSHLGSTDGSTVVYDKTNPVVTPVIIRSTNEDTQWAKLGDTVRVDFIGNEILYETDVTLAGASVTLYDSTGAAYVGSSECIGGDILTEDLKLWLDANDVDGDGTSEGMDEATLNGSDVAIWTDKSGNGANVIEVAGKGIPTLVQNQFNGQSTIQFNKSEEDVLIHDLGGSNWTATEYSLFVVFQQIGTPINYDSFFSNGDVPDNNYFQVTQLSGAFKFLTSDVTIEFEPWDNNLKLYGIIANSEGTSTIVDGNIANFNASTSGRSFDKYNINRNRSGSNYNNSYIAEVLLYDRELNGLELTKTYKYLGNKYGRSFTNDTTIVYTKKEMTATDPEGRVAINFVYNDCAGNDGTTISETSDDSYVIFDMTPPSDFTVGIVTATGGNVVANAWNSTNAGLDVTVPVESDTTLKNGWIQVWTKVGNNAFEKLGDSTTIANSDVGTDKVISFTSEQVEAITGFAEEDSIYIKAVMNDRPGNETVGTESSSRLLIDETPPSLISASYESNFSDSSLATVGHVVTLTFETDVEIQTPSATISTQNAIISDLGSNRWSASYEMQDGDTEGVIPFQIDTLTDSRGNPTEGTSSTTDGTIVTFDNTKPTLSSVKIVSNNADSSWAKVGDTVWVNFEADELLRSDSVNIHILNKVATLYSTGTWGWELFFRQTVPTYLTKEEWRLWNDGAPDSDNYSILNTIDDNMRRLDGKFEFKIIWPLRPGDNYNIWKQESNPMEAVSGGVDGYEAVDVNFTSQFWEGLEYNTNSFSLLDGSVNHNNWYYAIGSTESWNGGIPGANDAEQLTELYVKTAKYSYFIITEANDPEGTVEFEILVTDSVGLTSDPVTQTTDESLVIFDRTTPTLSTVHIESDNANNTLIAIGGDNIYLTFTPQEPLILDSIVVTIAGLATNLTESNGSYTATLTLTGSEPDGILEYTIDFKDRAGNPGIQVTSTTDGSYVNHDIYPPEIEIVSITSNNSDSTWAKVGDSVFVTFTASETLDNISITIAGVSSSYNELSVAKYQGYHVMDDSNDEGDIPFLITYTDLGGAIGPDADTTTNNTNVQFDKTVPEFSLIRMATNNVYGDSLAAIGSVDTLSFTISEVQNDLSVELAGSAKTPSQDGLKFSATHTFIASDTEGWVDFSISMTDSAGNPSDTLMTTQDGSQVRFDGTFPILPIVNFFSNNGNDSSVCIPGDSLFLQYTSSETLRTATITLAGNSPDESGWLGGFNYASYVLTGAEDEGFIPFTIGFEDWVGNPGDTISGTTNGSSVLFDMTPPDDFTLGDVVSKNGIEVAGYWNASNQTLEIAIPVANDETLPGGGIQFQASFGGSYSNLADTVDIDQGDLGMEKIVSISETDFESIAEFNENANATFQAVLWDKAGNTTIGTASTSTIHIDQTLPILGMVSQRTNNAIADSLAKVGDTDTLIVSSTEGLDTLQVQIFSQDAVHSGANRDWTFTYSFQETDNDDMVSFNIVFGDTAGNLGTDVSTTTDGSTVRFDGTKPTLVSVSFASSNGIDGGLAILADTLYLDFISDEDLLTKDVLIAGSDADTTFENESRTPFRSWRIMDGTEAEGYIEFEIGYSDLVGNIGDTVEETTNETSILFDMTPPDDFELDTVFVSGGKVIFGFWNASNDTLTLRVPIPEDDETLIGGTFQSLARFGEGAYVNLGDEKIIIGGQGVSSQDLKITRMEFTTVDGFSENLNVQFIAKAKDRAGNETVGSAYNTTFHIDEIVPSLTEVLIQSNNELDSAWAKISDIVSLNFTASEGLSSVTPVLFSDSLTGISENAGSSWTVTKTILSDNAEGVIPFYITYNDTAGNEGDQVSSSTDGRSVTFDKTNPTIMSLLEGNEGLDIDYYNQADSITLYWCLCRIGH
jgi:hypothetical protein